MDVYKLPVFEAADIFPMMSKDELEELANDISANGLKSEIVIAEVADENGELKMMLVDGRNRLAACKIAKVKPAVRQLNGEDPTAFVWSVNGMRRDMTKGQKAMAYAMMYPEPEKGGRGKKLYNNYTVSKQYVSQARTVLHNAPDLARSILDGSGRLDAAYEEARERIRKATGKEARLEKVREQFPDLATKVIEEELSLEAVEEEVRQRNAIKAEAQETAVRIFEDCLRNLAGFESDEFINKLKQWQQDEAFMKVFIGRVSRPNTDLKKCLKRMESFLTN